MSQWAKCPNTPNLYTTSKKLLLQEKERFVQGLLKHFQECIFRASGAYDFQKKMSSGQPWWLLGR